MTAPARILTIAGSDSGGGAGIAADLRTIVNLGGFGMLAVTAVTAQNTLGVFGIWPLAPDAVAQQIAVVRSDIGLDAAKTGMLVDAGIVCAVADVWEGSGVPLVVDPILISASGTRLLDEAGVCAVRERLVPLASVVTPNLAEAAALTGWEVESLSSRERAARRLVEMGARAALITGGHGSGADVVDLLFDGREVTLFHSPRQDTRHTHGTGCTLSAAIATALGQGLPLREAVARSIAYVQRAIQSGPGLGTGHGPLGIPSPEP
jgi:hydroxymethylpyrimidine/phosphomethylpyrimidine kinase